METIQGLWIGSELSAMERLSIESFLANGHRYHLYVYDDVRHVPAGALVKDANGILPAATIFKYKDSGSYAGFANYFRYKLLLEEGGWWADSDVVCLRPFHFDGEYVIASEHSDSGEEVAASCVIKAPQGSDLMRYAWETCRSKSPGSIGWGETGPQLMAEAVRRFGLDRYRRSYRTFCPVPHSQWRLLLIPETEICFDDETVAVHLWNELWRRAGQSKNAQYPGSSLYEQLKSRYLPSARTPGEEEALREVSLLRSRLLQSERELDSIYRSRAWKLVTRLRRIKYFFFDPNR